MSATTRSGGSMPSLERKRCSGSSASSFPRRKRSTPTIRILAMPSDDFNIASAYEAGLCRARAGEYFAAHEAFEAAWLLANPAERDFFQGLVHAVVFAYQAGRGKTIGAERQREKALARLGGYGPAHRGLDLEALLAALGARQADLREHLIERDPQPPVAVEEEQQTE